MQQRRLARSALLMRRKFAGARRRRGDAEPEGGRIQPAFAQVIGNLGQLIVAVDSADAAPTSQEITGSGENAYAGARPSQAMGGVKEQVTCTQQT